MEIVKANTIIGTQTTVFRAYTRVERLENAPFNAVTSINGDWFGQMGTERITEELDRLPPRTNERIKQVQRFHRKNDQRAHKVILQAHPELEKNYNARRDGPDIIVHNA